MGDRVSVNFSTRSVPDIGTPGTFGRISLVSWSRPPLESAYESTARSTAPASSEVAVSWLPSPAGRIWKLTVPVLPPCTRGAIEALPSALLQLSFGPKLARAFRLEPFASRWKASAARTSLFASRRLACAEPGSPGAFTMFRSGRSSDAGERSIWRFIAVAFAPFGSSRACTSTGPSSHGARSMPSAFRPASSSWPLRSITRLPACPVPSIMSRHRSASAACPTVTWPVISKRRGSSSTCRRRAATFRPRNARRIETLRRSPSARTATAPCSNGTSTCMRAVTPPEISPGRKGMPPADRSGGRSSSESTFDSGPRAVVSTWMPAPSRSGATTARTSSRPSTSPRATRSSQPLREKVPTPATPVIGGMPSSQRTSRPANWKRPLQDPSVKVGSCSPAIAPAMLTCALPTPPPDTLATTHRRVAGATSAGHQRSSALVGRLLRETWRSVAPPAMRPVATTRAGEIANASRSMTMAAGSRCATSDTRVACHVVPVTRSSIVISPSRTPTEVTTGCPARVPATPGRSEPARTRVVSAVGSLPTPIETRPSGCRTTWMGIPIASIVRGTTCPSSKAAGEIPTATSGTVTIGAPPAPNTRRSCTRMPTSRSRGSHSIAVDPTATRTEPSGALSADSRRGVNESRKIGPRDNRHPSPAATSTLATSNPHAARVARRATFHMVTDGFCLRRRVNAPQVEEFMGTLRRMPSGASRPRASPAEWTAAVSESVQLRDAFAMECRIAEDHLVRVRALEPQLEVELPGEPDAAVHLDRAPRRPAVDVAEARLRHRRGARCLARSLIPGVGGVPHERPRRLHVGHHLGGDVLDGLERADLAPELLAHLRVLHRHLDGALRTAQAVGRDADRGEVEEPRQERPPLSLDADQRGLRHCDVLQHQLAEAPGEVDE